MIHNSLIQTDDEFNEKKSYIYVREHVFQSPHYYHVIIQ